MKKYLLTILVVFLTGCASLPHDAPLFHPAPEPQEGDGLLYIYRYNAYPTLRLPDVFIQGDLIYEPIEKSYTWLHLEQGLYKVKIDWPKDTGWPDLEFEIDIVAGRTQYMKITGSYENDGRVEKVGSEARNVHPQIAEPEVRHCCRFMPLKNHLISKRKRLNSH